MSTNSPTVVLVHGALTDASIWHGVIAKLHQRNLNVVAPAMPLRGLRSDAAYLRSLLTTIEGPIVVAGHSYGGSIISHPDALTPAVRALVFIGAFTQDRGETAGQLNALFPGSKLTADTLLVRAYPGGNDLYLAPDCFADVYAGDVDASTAAVMAAAQHPIDATALAEAFDGETTWRSVPSWTLISTADHSIPTEALRFMSRRAGSHSVEIQSSHAIPVAHPDAAADIISAAVKSVADAAAAAA